MAGLKKKTSAGSSGLLHSLNVKIDPLHEDGRVLNTFLELARYDNKGLQIVSAIDLGASTIRIGGSMSVRLSGSNLTDRTWFDVRFRSPAGTREQVALNWQQGTSADHVVAAGTEVGIWVVTGIRAHENVDDHGGEFVPISATLTVTRGAF